MLVDLGCMNMAVSLQITGPRNTYQPVWDKFLDCMEARARTKYGSLKRVNGVDPTELEVDAELVNYGAWSNWDVWDDPLWFPDEDTMMTFVLSYS